ncbi:MAG: hypothetical protein J5644_09155 [Bacteroidales bacterium]|nr:hypothetical protein [Bacteroidales bacterium]
MKNFFIIILTIYMFSGCMTSYSQNKNSIPDTIQGTMIIDSIWKGTAYVYKSDELYQKSHYYPSTRQKRKVILIKAHVIENPYWWVEIITLNRKNHSHSQLQIGEKYDMELLPQMAHNFLYGTNKWAWATIGKKTFHINLEMWAGNLYVSPNLQGIKYIEPH